MRAMRAVDLFQSNWFVHNEAKLLLTDVQRELVEAALGREPARWRGATDIDAMETLLAAAPEALVPIGERLLAVAIGIRGCGEAVRALRRHGVSLDIDPTVYNVLHEAAWAGAADTLEAVFETGMADATAVSVKRLHTGWPDNVSLMYWAAWGGYPDVARLLIAHGAGVHHELPIRGNGERGTTSLQEAVAPGPWKEDSELRSNAGKREVAAILIADGAAYDACSAAGLGDSSRLANLIRERPEAAAEATAFGMTPLHWAARAGETECAGLLIDAGAAVDARAKSRRTPLQLAAEQDRAGIVTLLAGRGADLDTQDGKGRTPLHRATYEGGVAAAQALLEAGADPTVKNRNGKTAFEIARKEAKVFKTRA